MSTLNQQKGNADVIILLLLAVVVGWACHVRARAEVAYAIQYGGVSVSRSEPDRGDRAEVDASDERSSSALKEEAESLLASLGDGAYVDGVFLPDDDASPAEKDRAYAAIIAAINRGDYHYRTEAIRHSRSTSGRGDARVSRQDAARDLERQNSPEFAKKKAQLRQAYRD